MSNYTYEIDQITEVLATMRAIEPLPPIGSPAYYADMPGWQARRAQIAECEQTIEILALLTVPPEISALVAEMRATRKALFPVITQSEEAPHA